MTITGNYGLLFLAFWPLAAAFISYGIGRADKKSRDYFANFATILEFGVAVALAFFASNTNPPMFEWVGFGGFRIYFLLDGFRCIYVLITAFMWMMTTLFSREYFTHYHNRNRYYFFMLLTYGGTMGVFLSADLLTTFMFFEIMSFTSYVMVIHDEKPQAQEAAKTYMAVAVLGGLVMLMGIFLANHHLGTTQFDQLGAAVQNFEGKMALLYASAACMLFGFGGKAGMWPLHIWLPNAHPVAPAPASALLSGVLTKTGVFGIIVVSTGMFFHNSTWGMVILIIGVLGMFTGAFIAVFSIDLKRTLACSSMSQIGFILVGVGMQNILGEHNALAVRGTLLHMVNHSLIKLVLFMMAGVVYMNLHELDLNKIRGFGRNKPLITFCFLMGVLGIIGLPSWNGYISKTLLHESIVEQIWLYPDYSFGARFFQVVESIFTLTGGLTTAYMIKIFVAVCIEKNQFDQKKMDNLNGRYMNKTTSWVLFLSAIILPILGFFPKIMMEGIGKFGQVFMQGHDPAHAVEFFAWINLRGAVASLSIGAIVYIFIVRGCLMTEDEEGRSIYINAWPKWIDLETYIYRPLLLNVLPFIGALFARTIGNILPAIAALGYRIFMKLRGKAIVSAENKPPEGSLVVTRNTYQKKFGSSEKDLITAMRESYHRQTAYMQSSGTAGWEDASDHLREGLLDKDRNLGLLYLEGEGDQVPALRHLDEEPSVISTEDQEAGLMDWVGEIPNKLRKLFGIDPVEPKKKGDGLQRDLIKVFVSSLSYSLLLLLVGLVVVLVTVIGR